MAKTPSSPDTPADARAAAPVQNQSPAVTHQDPGVTHAEAPVAATAPKLITRTTDGWGARGAFVDATPQDLARAPEGLLVDPTPEQLARRRQ